MKKIFSILLTVLLLASLSITAFADNYVPSVTNAAAEGEDIELLRVIDADGNDVTDLVVYNPYKDINKLAADAAEELSGANQVLKDAENLADLNDELKEAAGDRQLVVREVFDLSLKEGAEVKFPLTITLKGKNLNGFAALLHFLEEQWNWVDSNINGDELTFDVDSLSPFAILVYADAATSANTGEANPALFIAGAVILAGAAVFFFMKSRKVEA